MLPPSNKVLIVIGHFKYFCETKAGCIKPASTFAELTYVSDGGLKVFSKAGQGPHVEV